VSPAKRKRSRSPEPAVRAISRTNSASNPVVIHLQRQVANAFVLYANYKRGHWQAYGPLFRSFHQLYDELAADVLGTLDELADRLRMIGQDPIATPREVIEEASVTPASIGSMRSMCEAANEQLLEVIRELREAQRAAVAAEDPGSAELFSRTVQVHERHEWFLRNLTKVDDSFSIG
jgi:starvation-inducible DNA-binding protein